MPGAAQIVSLLPLHGWHLVQHGYRSIIKLQLVTDFTPPPGAAWRACPPPRLRVPGSEDDTAPRDCALPVSRPKRRPVREETDWLFEGCVGCALSGTSSVRDVVDRLRWPTEPANMLEMYV